MEILELCPVCGKKDKSVFLDTSDFSVSKEKFTIDQCNACGFRFLNPRPTQQEIGRYYESDDYISHSNTNKGLVNFLYQQVRKFTLKKKVDLISSLTKEKSLLDIGCGTGEFLNVAKENGWHTLGIEPSDSARGLALKNYRLKVDTEDFLERCAERFSVITMWHVLEHVHALNQRIEVIKRLLTDEGTLLIAVPNPESYDAVHYGKFWAAYDLPRHLYHFTEADIRRLFSNHGMEVVNVKPMFFDSFYVSMLSEKYKGTSGLLNALMVGLRSNLKAGKTKNYSSKIYLIKKTTVK